MLHPIRPSRRTELWYRAQLGALVGRLRRAGAALAEELRSAWPRSSQDAGIGQVTVADETERVLPSLLHQQAAKFGDIAAQARKLAELAALKNLGDVDERLAKALVDSVGVNLIEVLKADNRIASEFELAVTANVELITSIPAQYFERVRQEIEQGWQQGIRWESLAEKLHHIGDITESRAKFIARDQTAKMNSEFNRVRQTSVGIAKYIWSTSQDERVRPSHARLHGTTWAWNAPPIVDGEAANPGMPVNCRCLALPVFELDEPSIVELQAEAA